MSTITIEVKGYDNGYQAAIEAIKRSLMPPGPGPDGDPGTLLEPDPRLEQPESKGGDNSGSGSGSGSGSKSRKGGTNKPKEPGNDLNGGGSDSNGGGSDSNGGGNGPSGDGSGSNGGGSGSGSKSRKGGDNSTNDRDVEGTNGKTGQVRKEDTKKIGKVDDCNAEPGGLIDTDTAKKIAAAEGYPDESITSDMIERDWRDISVKAASKMKGSGPGNQMLRDKINQIWKTNHNWKKELIKIVGQSINPDNSRQAYAHKNTLISQDRVARTDKDKYDTTDFMMVWIDSSGSMSDDQLKMCLREVYHVALAKKPIKLVVVQCDAAIQDIIEYTNLQQLKNDTINAIVKGRGGTELGPCWKLIQKDPKYSRRPADLVMIFTDGCLKQYKRDPLHMKNLCWVILDNTDFELEYKDRYTKCVHMCTDDIR